MDKCDYEPDSNISSLNSLVEFSQDERTFPPSLPATTLASDVGTQRNVDGVGPNKVHGLTGGFQIPTFYPSFYYPNPTTFAPIMDHLIFPTKYPLELDVDFSGMANLEEVPMEIVTSDEDETADKVASNIISDEDSQCKNEDELNTDRLVDNVAKAVALNWNNNGADEEALFTSPPFLPQSRSNYANELDEIELRTRALRSLLLLKHTRATESIQNRAPFLPTDISTNKISIKKVRSQPAIERHKNISFVRTSNSTKLLAIGSGKLRAISNNQNLLSSSERFIIHLSDSSSSEEDDLSETLFNGISSTHKEVNIGGVEEPPSQPVSSATSYIAHLQPPVITSAVSGSVKSPVPPDMTSVSQSMTEMTQPGAAITDRSSSTAIKPSIVPFVQNKRPIKRLRKVATPSSKSLASCYKSVTGLSMHRNHRTVPDSQTHAPGSRSLSVKRNPGMQTGSTTVTTALPAEADGKRIEQNHTGASSLSTDSFITSVYLRIRKRLMQLSLDILQRTRSTSTLSSIFSFDPHSNIKYSNPDGSSCLPRPPTRNDNDHPSSDGKPSAAFTACTYKVNPSIPLCPFLLDGECKDKHCIYQHPAALCRNHDLGKIDGKGAVSNSNNLCVGPARTSSVNELTAIPITVPPNLTDENCQVCQENLDMSFSASTLTAMQKWHTLYRAYKRSQSKNALSFSQFRTESLEILKTVPTSSQVVRHHISILCLSSGNNQFAADILTTLKLTAFSVSACRMVLHHTSVSPFIRISLGQLVLECLLSKIFSTEQNSPPCASLDLPFIHLVYHICRLKLDLGYKVDAVITVLDDLLKKLPSDHFLRWALWWFKLHLSIALHLPSEESLSFSTPSCQLLPKLSVKNSRTLIEEAVKDLRIVDLALCNSATSLPRNSLSFCCLSVVNIYTQLLHLLEQFQDASQYCLGLYKISPLWISEDDLLFTTATHSLFITHSTSLDWPTVVSKSSWLSDDTCSANDYLSFRIEFHFLFAILTWRKKMQKTAKTVLVELLGSLTMVNSDEELDVLCGFRDLLGVSSQEGKNCNSVTVFLESLNARGQTYLWLSYCLYCLLCNTSGSVLETLLGQLIDYYHRLPEAHNCAFTSLLLRMIMAIANRIHSSESDAYAVTIRTVFLDTPLKSCGVGVPNWFLEVVKSINLKNLPSPGVRHDICVQLVETYGAPMVLTLCRSLFALDDRFLASGLCSIAKLDKPDRVDFWLLSAALLVSDQVPEGVLASKHRMSTLSQLVELLDEAVTLIPSSVILWQLYTDAVMAFSVYTDQLLKRAVRMGMRKVVSNEMEALKPSKKSNVTKKSNLKTSRRGASGTPLSTNRWNKLITSKYIFKIWASRNSNSTPNNHYQRLRLQRKPTKS